MEPLFGTTSNPVVEVRSFKELTSYLLDRIPTWHGLPVIRYYCNPGLAVWAVCRYPDGTRSKRHHVGFIPDVIHNIERGFYEPQEEQDD